MNKTLTLVAVLGVVVSSQTAVAQIYNNLGPGDTYNNFFQWGVGNFGSGNLEYAMWFGTVGAGGATVDSVTLALNKTYNADSIQVDDAYIVSIAAIDGTGTPTDIYTWNNVIGTGGLQTLSTGSGVSLTAGSRYAIHVGLQDGFDYQGGWLMSNSANDGLSFQYANTGWNNYGNAPSGAMRIDGQGFVVTPEPVTMGLGLAGAALFIRRRRKATSRA